MLGLRLGRDSKFAFCLGLTAALWLDTSARGGVIPVAPTDERGEAVWQHEDAPAPGLTVLESDLLLIPALDDEGAQSELARLETPALLAPAYDQSAALLLLELSDAAPEDVRPPTWERETMIARSSAPSAEPASNVRGAHLAQAEPVVIPLPPAVWPGAAILLGAGAIHAWRRLRIT